MDNTILDSDKPHILAYNMTFRKNKLRQVSAKRLKKFFGLVSYEIIKKLFPKLKNKEIIKLVNDNNMFFMKETKRFLKAFNGVKHTLIKLKKRYKLALISNCTHEEILASLKIAKIDLKIFDALIGNDDVKKPKPFSDEIFKAGKILHSKIKWVIGDSIYDIRAGKRAKTKTIAVLTGNHTKNELKKEKPDYILRNFNQVLRIL